MTLEETIIESIRSYPLLFSTGRVSVLDHLFCTNGNGYEWVDGELVNLFKDEANRNPEEVKAEVLGFIETITEGIDKMEKWPDCIKDLYREWKEEREHLIDWTLRSAEDLAEKITLPEYFYPICEYSCAWEVPTDAKPDWVAGIRETMAYVLKTDLNWEHPRGLVSNAKNHEWARKILKKLDEMFGEEGEKTE